MKAIVLARISTKEQQDGHSLNAQIKNLKLYAERHGLEIVKQYTLVESSTKKQRPEFDKMIKFIKNSNNKMALIVDTVDRLQRSFRETPILNDLMQEDILELHFVKEGNVISKSATSSQKLMWNMGVVMAQSYTDQLSDNVKRTINFKVKNGEWCGPATLGYINTINESTRKADIVPDPDTSEMIRSIFMDYSTGAYSLAELARKYTRQGLKSKAGNEIRIQQLHKLIQNPFYFGEMLIKGKRYKHKYEPLISRAIFNRCQKVLNTRGNTKAVKETKYPFVYRGLVQCGVSGRQVTCDLKKGRYFYLICRAPDDPSKKIWVKQDAIDEQIKRVLMSLQFSDERMKEVNDYISEAHDSEEIICKNLSNEINEISRQVDKLTQLLIDDAITHDIYERKVAKLHQKRDETTALVEGYDKGGEDLSDALKALLTVANSGFLVFNSSKMLLKRELLILLFSNLEITRCKLGYTLREPFRSVRNLGENLLWRQVVDTVRTQHHQEIMDLYHQMNPSLLNDL